MERELILGNGRTMMKTTTIYVCALLTSLLAAGLVSAEGVESTGGPNAASPMPVRLQI
jgi:hypothetical protein